MTMIHLLYIALFLQLSLAYLRVECRLEDYAARIKFWRNPARRSIRKPNEDKSAVFRRLARSGRDNFTSYGEATSTLGNVSDCSSTTTPAAAMKHAEDTTEAEFFTRASSSLEERTATIGNYERNTDNKWGGVQHRWGEDSTTPITSFASAIFILIQETITMERCRKAVCWVGVYWLIKKVIQEMGTLLDEMQDEILKEDHDNLLFTAETVAQVSTLIIQPPKDINKHDEVEKIRFSKLENQGHQEAHNNLAAGKSLGSMVSKKDKSKSWSDPRLSKTAKTSIRHITPKHQYARDLIVKLHAAGLPLESQQVHTASTEKTADSVLRSLTKAEGSLLANCLLVPQEALGNESPGQIIIDPKAEWENIGGLADVKEALMDLVLPLTTSAAAYQQHQKTSASYGDLLSHPSGLLLFGPPGCGKTLLAKALAFTAGARFLCIKHSDLQRKYYGDTNLRVRALFSLARKIQPCIIFVDEVDGIFRERYSAGSGGEEHDASRDLKTEFMQLWDGISSSKLDRIFVMGATNRPFDVDAAFLRRMPRAYFVGLPDLSARISILRKMLRGVPLSPDFDIEMIAYQTQGYSPSDLKELLRVAVLAPLREARANSIAANIPSKRSLGTGLPVLPHVAQLRALHTSDVMKARRIVAPTQYSAAYRSAIAEYVSRYQGSLISPVDDASSREYSDSDEEESSDLVSEGDGMSSFDED